MNIKQFLRRSLKIELNNGGMPPARKHPNDAGSDLFTPDSFTIPPHGSFLLDTGVHIMIPSGQVGLILPRSSMNLKGILTPVGVIDSGYTGSIKVVLVNMNNTAEHFERNDRIAQLVIIPCSLASMVCGKVTNIKTARGDGGFGSTN